MAKKSKALIKFTLPKPKPTYMPVTKANQTIKSKKDYTRKPKHKKSLV